MYDVTIDKQFWFSGLSIPAGDYVFDAVCLAQALVQDAVGTVEKTKWVYEDHYLKEGDPGDIVIARVGAFGDLLGLTPLIDKIREDYLMPKVVVACHPRYAPILEGVVETIDYPLNQKDFNNFGEVIWMEGVIERPDDPLSKYVDRYAQRAGYTEPVTSKVKYIVTPEEDAWAEDYYPKEKGKIRMGLQMKASALNRTYSRRKNLEVIQRLLARNTVDEVVLFGAPGEINFPDDIDNIINLSSAGVSVRKSAAVLLSCDIQVVPDSLFLHLGAALDIPTIALCGAFDTAQALCYNAPHVHTLRGMGLCRNCRYQPVGGNQFPTDQDCSVTGNCHVIDGISPDSVSHAVSRVLKGKDII